MFPIIILVLTLLLAYGFLTYRKFDLMLKDEVSSLLTEAVQPKPTIITEAMLHGLPEPVQRYLRYTGVVGTSIPRLIRLKQNGRFRMSPQRPWMRITAEEYYSVVPPRFIWIASAKQAGIPLFRGRDRYQDGQGLMDIKVGSLVSVVHASGDATNQAAMMRYLSEMIFFPAAFLGDNIHFEAIDNHAAKVTITNCVKVYRERSTLMTQAN